VTTAADRQGLAAGHPFRGLPVAETAGLRLRAGSRCAMFDQDVWDLTGLIDAPAVMSSHRKILDFTTIANPRWRQVAREYLLARLAPHHPAVATLPHAFRAPLNPNSLWAELKQLTAWFNHLTSAGVASLAEVDQRHCDTYLDGVARSATTPGRRLSPATTVASVRATKTLALRKSSVTATATGSCRGTAAAPRRSPVMSALSETGCHRCPRHCCGRCWPPACTWWT
jgi:hypothetical protein